MYCIFYSNSYIQCPTLCFILLTLYGIMSYCRFYVSTRTSDQLWVSTVTLSKVTLELLGPKVAIFITSMPVV